MNIDYGPIIQERISLPTNHSTYDKDKAALSPAIGFLMKVPLSFYLEGMIVKHIDHIPILQRKICNASQSCYGNPYFHHKILINAP